MINPVPDHTDNLVATGKRNHNEEDIAKPAAVIAYNKTEKEEGQ